MITSIYRGLADGMDPRAEWQRPLGPLHVCWTEDDMEMWKAGEGEPLIEKYNLYKTRS